jgi:hypothetical protein
MRQISLNGWGFPVADLKFSLALVTSLAEKLSQVQNLTGPEHDLLLAIFAAAAARAQLVGGVDHSSTLPLAEVSGQQPPANVTPDILKQQLLNAYIPGNYFQAVEAFQASTIGDQNPPPEDGNK